jgi:hypothetical protein
MHTYFINRLLFAHIERRGQVVKTSAFFFVRSRVQILMKRSAVLAEFFVDSLFL